MEKNERRLAVHFWQFVISLFVFATPFNSPFREGDIGG